MPDEIKPGDRVTWIWDPTEGGNLVLETWRDGDVNWLLVELPSGWPMKTPAAVNMKIEVPELVQLPLETMHEQMPKISAVVTVIELAGRLRAKRERAREETAR